MNNHTNQDRNNEMPNLSRQPRKERIWNIGNSTGKSEVRRRAPWIFVGLMAGIVMILTGRHFEESLSEKLELVFFIPMIVYMSGVIGAETLALFVRELALRQVNLQKLFLREVRVGLSLGAISGLPMGVFCYLWLQDFNLALTITIAMIFNGLVAVFLGMLTPVIFSRLREDPAIGSEEVGTAISDVLSMFIYLLVASLIIF